MHQFKPTNHDATIHEYFSNSSYGRIYGPAIDYAVKLAEIVLLGVAFKVAAEQTGHALLNTISYFFMLCAGVLIGNVSGVVSFLLDKYGFGVPSVRLFVGLFAFGSIASLSLWVSIELVDAINQMANVNIAND